MDHDYIQFISVTHQFIQTTVLDIFKSNSINISNKKIFFLVGTESFIMNSPKDKDRYIFIPNNVFLFL